MADVADQELIQLVQDNWQQFRRPMLLSTLGGLMGREALLRAKLRSGTLRAYVLSHFPDELRVVPLPGHGDGVVPRDGAAGSSDAEFAAQWQRITKERLSNDTEKLPLFCDSVWSAFRDPPASGRRFLELRKDAEPIRHDLGFNEGPSPDWLEVLATDVPRPEADGSDPANSAIAEAIRRWAKRHGLDDTRALRRNAPPRAEGGSSEDGKRPSAPATRDGVAALEAFLSRLAPAELRRVKLTGDVILSIIKSRH